VASFPPPFVNVVEARDKAREYYRGLTTSPEETVIKE